MTTLSDCFKHWEVKPDTEEILSSADVIATHEFGDQKTPSASTTAIVDIAAALSKKFNKPCITQLPGDQVLMEQNKFPKYVISENLKVPGGYLDTEEVNRQIAQVCKEHGWKRVILCAHPHHLWRAGENLRRHGIEPVFPDVSDVPYDSKCSRRALRTPWFFIPREIRARIIYRKRKYI